MKLPLAVIAIVAVLLGVVSGSLFVFILAGLGGLAIAGSGAKAALDARERRMLGR